MKAIPTRVQTVEIGTGKVIKNDFVDMMLMPPRPGNCGVCGIDHGGNEPHNAQSMYWGVAFKADHGRAPTWADAIAHCDEAVQRAWTVELKRMKHWTQPPKGCEPIRLPYYKQASDQ